jgi:predicted GNAT family acetyltransferase
MADFEVTEHAETLRFELLRDGVVVGFANYSRAGNTVVVPHVETDAAHRGRGFGAILVDGLLDILRERGDKIVPVCSFAAEHIRARPQHQDLLA